MATKTCMALPMVARMSDARSILRRFALATMFSVSVTDYAVADVVLNDGSMSQSDITSMMADTELSKLYVSRNQYTFWEFMDDQIHELFNGDPGPDIYDDTSDMAPNEYEGISQPNGVGVE
ncbi:MAG: hypothetical protein ACOYMG_14805 [Candidatus Methylumidiphilus sp.]